MSRGLIPGDEVDGRYRLERRLGSGGMGEVFAALDLQREQHVALKVFRPTSLADDVARERLLREGRAAVRVAHANVVRVHEVGAGEPAYITMELLEGEDLSERVDRAGALPIGLCEQLARDLAEALIAMHDAGVVHRDLKPKNVFLPREGGLKVLDFGLAKADFLGDSLTEAQQVFGTLNYLAPEQLRSATLADERSDIWAFGTVLFEALTGHPAFPGRDAPQVVTTISTLEALPVSALRPEVPARLVELVRRALRRDPTLRFQSARELRAAIDDEVAPRSLQTESMTSLVSALPLGTQRQLAPRRRVPSNWVSWLLAVKGIAILGWLLHADATSAERKLPEPVAAPQQVSGPLQCTAECAEPAHPEAAPALSAPVRALAPRKKKPRKAEPAPSEVPMRVSPAGELRRSEF